MDRRIFLRSLSLAVIGSTFVPRYGRWFRPNASQLPHRYWRLALARAPRLEARGIRVEAADPHWRGKVEFSDDGTTWGVADMALAPGDLVMISDRGDLAPYRTVQQLGHPHRMPFALGQLIDG